MMGGINQLSEAKVTIACATGPHNECFGTRYKAPPHDITVLGPCECSHHDKEGKDDDVRVEGSSARREVRR